MLSLLIEVGADGVGLSASFDGLGRRAAERAELGNRAAALVVFLGSAAGRRRLSQELVGAARGADQPEFADYLGRCLEAADRLYPLPDPGEEPAVDPTRVFDD